jgi:hypothetical protein
MANGKWQMFCPTPFQRQFIEEIFHFPFSVVHLPAARLQGAKI